MTAKADGSHARPLAHEQDADTLGRIDFVPAHGVKIHAQSVHVYRYLGQSLHSIGMQIQVRLVGDARDFRDRLQRAEFVIGVHHSNQNRGSAQRAADIVRIDHTARADAHVGHGNALALQLRARIQHRRVLDGRSHDMHLLTVGVEQNAEQRQIVRFSAAADKNDLLRLATDKRSRLPARHFQALLGHLPEMMDTGRVAVHFGETRHRGLDDLRGHGCCRVMVEVKVIHFF